MYTLNRQPVTWITFARIHDIGALKSGAVARFEKCYGHWGTGSWQIRVWSWQNRITDNTNNNKIKAPHRTSQNCDCNTVLQLETTMADRFLETETVVRNFHIKLSNVRPIQFFLGNFSSERSIFYCNSKK